MKTQDRQTRGIQAGFLLLLFVAWDLVGRFGLINPIFVPNLWEVLDKFAGIIASGEVFGHLLVTVSEMLSAFALAATAGLLAGYVIGRSAYAAKIFEPLLAGVFAIPIIIFLPLFLLFLGIGVESKIAFGATYAFFPIVLNTIGGIRQVDPRLIAVARSMGATDSLMFRRVLLPAALPVIVTGIRIGGIIGFLAIIGGEMIASLDGLGSQIVRLGEGMNTAAIVTYIVFVIMLRTLLNPGLTWLPGRFVAGGGVR